LEEIKREEKKPSVWSIILIVFLVLVFLFLLFIGYGAGVNNRFYKLLVVTSGSMSPTFEAGDLIMIVKVDPEKVKVGDIVTFQTRDKEILTHRVVEIKPDGEIVTKGDANEEVDSWTDGWKLGKVETIYVFKFPKLGFAISWLQGLFSGNTTGAWLSDTQKTKVGLEAGQWEVPEIPGQMLMPTPSESVEPIESPSPEPTESLEPSPSKTPSESPLPSPSEETNSTPTESPNPSESPQTSPEPTESLEPSPTPSPSETPSESPSETNFPTKTQTTE
jgi:signal peptidase I